MPTPPDPGPQPPRRATDRIWIVIDHIAKIIGIIGGLASLTGQLVPFLQAKTPPGAPEPRASAVALHAKPLSIWRAWTSSRFEDLAGSVSVPNGAPLDYGLVIYTFTWDPGGAAGFWYVQPYEQDCLTRINTDRAWVARVHRGDEYLAILVHSADALKLAQNPAGSASPQSPVCLFPQKVTTAPPAGYPAITWTRVRAPSRWNAVRDLGLILLVAAVILWILSASFGRRTNALAGRFRPS